MLSWSAIPNCSAEQLGIADQLNIVVGSDFGRTPHYSAVGNPESGKDHHPVTSWMSMLWNESRDAGLRVVGETNDGVLAKPLNDELMPVESGGTMVTPALLHKNLRRLAGIEGTMLDTRFALSGSDLSVWT